MTCASFTRHPTRSRMRIGNKGRHTGWVGLSVKGPEFRVVGYSEILSSRFAQASILVTKQILPLWFQDQCFDRKV